MPRLEFYLNSERQATIKLDASEVQIGRSPECAICIPDTKVSRVHVSITKRDGGHQIENLGANGTKVNGRRLEEPRILEAGDVIFVSRYVLIYRQDEVAPVENASTLLIE